MVADDAWEGARAVQLYCLRLHDSASPSLWVWRARPSERQHSHTWDPGGQQGAQGACALLLVQQHSSRAARFWCRSCVRLVHTDDRHDPRQRTDLCDRGAGARCARR